MTDTDGAARLPARSWLRTNRGTAACLSLGFAALLVYLLSTDWVFQELRDGFILGGFTLVSVFAMLVCCISIMVDRHHAVVEDEMQDMAWMDWVVVLCAVALCYGYFTLAWKFDFVIVSAVVMTGTVYTLGVRPLGTALVSGVVIAVVIFTLFWTLGIRLPSLVFAP